MDWLFSSRRSWYFCLKLRWLDTSYDEALFFTCLSLCQKQVRLKCIDNILILRVWSCKSKQLKWLWQRGQRNHYPWFLVFTSCNPQSAKITKPAFLWIHTHSLFPCRKCNLGTCCQTEWVTFKFHLPFLSLIRISNPKRPPDHATSSRGYTSTASVQGKSDPETKHHWHDLLWFWGQVMCI